MKTILIPVHPWLTPLFSRIIAVLREFLVRVSYHLPEWLYYFKPFVLLKYEVCALSVSPQSEITVTKVLESDLNALSDMSGKDSNVFKKRLKNGDIGFVAKDHNGRCAGYKWLEIANEHYEEECFYSIALPIGSAWTYDHYVHPGFRKKGIWKILTDFECSHAESQGIKSIYCYVGQLNLPSLKAQKSFGFYVICKYVYLNICGLRLLFSYDSTNV